METKTEKMYFAINIQTNRLIVPCHKAPHNVGSIRCQANCDLFLSINKEEKFVTCKLKENNNVR